jgi:lipopolysaccharide transport system ATP-binding protein
MQAIIEAHDLGKQYRLGVSRHAGDSFRELLVRTLRRPLTSWRRPYSNHGDSNGSDCFWALRDVTFDVKEGEILAILGPNGAGKSTLLKSLSRITEPTSGQVRIRGRLASLLEVGTGFHPELTGRENVFLNGVMLGMRRAEILSKFDEIVGFAGIERFIDTPVKRYSSGMYVRLAFAVAAHLHPEILVIDEVLAVGDIAFQKKCLGKMSEVSRSGRTVVFVSHNVAAIQSLCTTGLVLREGRLCFRGSVKEALQCYHSSFFEQHEHNGSFSFDLVGAKTRRSTPFPLLRRLELFSTDDSPPLGGIAIGAPLRLRITFHLSKLAASCDLYLGFDDLSGRRIFTASTLHDPTLSLMPRTGEQVATCAIPAFTLMPGEYKIRVQLNVNSEEVDWVECGGEFTVLPTDYYGTGKVPKYGTCVLRQQWQFE